MIIQLQASMAPFARDVRMPGVLAHGDLIINVVHEAVLATTRLIR